jgi:hypothetical protein
MNPTQLEKPTRQNYQKVAAHRFLETLPHLTPDQAVRAGTRTLRQWTVELDLARAEAGITEHQSRQFEGDQP